MESLVTEKNTLGRTFIRCSSLKNIYLGEKISEIPSYTFYGCRGLSTIKIPSSVRNIGKLAFGDCQMTSLEIPEGIEELNEEIYSGYGLDSLVLPASLKSIKAREGTVFGSSTRLKDLTCKSIIPLSETGFTNNGFENATLHVPYCSIENYQSIEVWNSFGNIVPLEEELSRIEVYSDFDLSCTDGISEKAELILTNRSSDSQWFIDDPAGHLTFSAERPLKINRFTQIQNKALNTTTQKPFSTTLVANNTIVADTVELHLFINNFNWNFVSFPFDVSVDDIFFPENTGWVIRKYSGQDRAAMVNNSWQDLKSGMMLNAYEGYIIHASLVTDSWGVTYNGPWTVEMKVHAVDNVKKNMIFASDNVLISLNDYPSEFGHNQSWNLIGNPYPCYYDIRGLDFRAPLTVWDNINRTYTVVSPLDDNYILSPNEAFFVQKSNQFSALEFDCRKRLHSINESQTCGLDFYNQVEDMSIREVYNFYISDEKTEDKSRIVLNEFAKSDYEVERDASKFLSFESKTPQIFSYQDGIRYAINERPADSEGYYLGISIGDPGVYTLRMESRILNVDVYLTDIITGEKINLRNGSYSFMSDKGNFNRRFKVQIIKADTSQSSINAISKDRDTTNTEVYNLKGQRVNNAYKGIKIVNGNLILK